VTAELREALTAAGAGGMVPSPAVEGTEVVTDDIDEAGPDEPETKSRPAKAAARRS
jgi:hypothetical protein